MIKVNLLRNMGATQGAGMGGISEFTSASTSSGSRNQAFSRLAIILAFPISIYVYDSIANSALEKELAEVQTKLQQIQAEKANFGDAGVKTEKLTKERKVIDEQVDAIRKIARSRLREVKSLDALQSLLPQRTWLSRVTMQNSTVRITGYTNAEEGIADLIRGLESSAFFSKVEPRSTTQEKIGTTDVKKFELDFMVGKQVQE